MKKAFIIFMTVIILTNSVSVNYAMAENKFFTEGGYGGGGGTAEALTISGLLALLLTVITKTSAIDLPDTRGNVDYLKLVLKDDLNSNKPPEGSPPTIPYFDELSNYIVRKSDAERTLKEDILREEMLNDLDEYYLLPGIDINITLADRMLIARHLMEYSNVEALQPEAPITLRRDNYIFYKLNQLGYSQNAINSINQEFLDDCIKQDFTLTMFKNRSDNLLQLVVADNLGDNVGAYGALLIELNRKVFTSVTRMELKIHYGSYGTSLTNSKRLIYNPTTDTFTYSIKNAQILEQIYEYNPPLGDKPLEQAFSNIIYCEKPLIMNEAPTMYTRPNDMPYGGTLQPSDSPWNIRNIKEDIVIKNNKYLGDALRHLDLDKNTSDDLGNALENADKNGKQMGEPVLNNIETDVNMDNEPVTGNILQRVLTWLFKPRADKLEGAIAEIQETFDDQAGLLTYPLTLVIEFLMKVGNLEPGDCIITIPPINYKGHELFGGTSFNFTEFVNKQEFNGIYVIYIFIVDFIMILGFLNLAAKKGDEIIRGN